MRATITSTPLYPCVDTTQADGCYVTFERLLLEDCGGADLGYLQQGYEECSAEEAMRYKAEDAKRLAAYERGEWSLIGVRARAVIRWVRNGVATTYCVDSAGIFGVESDSGEEELNAIYEVEKAELHDMLAAIGAATYSK